MNEMVKMFLCGVAVGGSIVGAIAVGCLFNKIAKAETAHDRYVKAVRKANKQWCRHPRAVRHRKHPAPLPMNLWGN